MSEKRYLVTARKYRPQRFDELVAQEHVTETLRNALRLDRLAHAYLFSGPRGVGKTTAARILAKAINCTRPLDERDGQAEPCRACEHCRTFEEGRSLNVIEIDAASNNRVDDIRDLRETVRIPPQGAHRKVYIVDEVHMLSTAAFNALLKTLEEPPPHVLFIFATTEPHKVLATILSRCQRFDFRRIAVPEIVARLSTICKEENIRADEASLLLIARKGDGALRDALSVFDQAVSLCGSEIAYSDLVHALGVVAIDRYFEITDCIAARDMGGMLQLVENAIRAGHDLQEFMAGLTEHVRNLLVARTMEHTGLIEATEANRQRYAEAVAPFSEMDILRLLTLASHAENTLRDSIQPRLKVETILLNMATIALGADLREALDKIDRLEGNPSPDRAERTPPARPRTPQKTAPRQSNASAAASHTPRQNPGATTSHTPRKARERKAASKPAGDDPAETAPAPVPATPAPKAAPAAQASDTSPDASPDAIHDLLGKPALQRDNIPSEETRPQGPVAEERAAAPEPAEPSEADHPDETPVAGAWNDLLERVKEDNKNLLLVTLNLARLEGYDKGVLRLAIPTAHHGEVVTEHSDYLVQQARRLAPLADMRKIACTVCEDLNSADTDDQRETDIELTLYIERKREENPVVREVFKQFDAEPAW